MFISKLPAPGSEDPSAIIDIRNLTIKAKGLDRQLTLVDRLNLTVRKGEILGVIGESGSGKTLSCYAMMGLLASSLQATGEVIFDNKNVLGKSDDELSDVRGSEIAMIFQDPNASLNPLHRIGSQIAEKLIVHRRLSRRSAYQRAVQLMDMVGIPNAEARMQQYPHEFSGGMCQRVMIAMALSCEPQLLIADEPTAALDTTTQAQILNTIVSLSRTHSMGVVFVTHDLSIVEDIADRVAVMYAGRLVELGSASQIVQRPHHPYTRALIEASPSLDKKVDRFPSIRERIMQVDDDGNYCTFSNRCHRVDESCKHQRPPQQRIDSEHYYHCVLHPENL